MKKHLFLPALILLASTLVAGISYIPDVQPDNDEVRIAELDKYWTELSRTVREGDFEGYSATYHPDAVVIFATGENKSSVPVSGALASWKQGFVDTKEGKNKSDVVFRFSQRLGSPTTAHETGIFIYTSHDADGNELANVAVHFEMLLVKKDGKWLGVMEYQKHQATPEEWEALK